MLLTVATPYHLTTEPKRNESNDKNPSYNIKEQVSFAEYRLFYRAFWQKRLLIFTNTGVYNISLNLMFELKGSL